MSGGHFSYKQSAIHSIAEEIKEVLENKDNYYGLDEEDKEIFTSGILFLEIAYIYAQRIDWYLSGDDGKEQFIKRLNEELDNWENENDTKETMDITN
jgi:hypothetical protein